MRVKSVVVRDDDSARSEYVVEPCEDEFPYKPDPLAGGLQHLTGRQLHEAYSLVGESPI